MEGSGRGEQLERLKKALSDRYLVEREIGRGGMATVYLARDQRHDRQVAIKVLHPELAAAVGSDRFLTEIRVTANLQHPHILPLFDSGEAGGHVYYVMPFVEGESLQARLERERQLPVEEAIDISSDVADALDHAHRQGVVHRDIKPGNILLRDGRALVADFGIALAVRAAGGAHLTRTGVPIGTPLYMSPEQAKGDRPADARSDLYSLGCVLYEMLSGEAPHTGASIEEVLVKKLTQTPTPVRERRDTVPVHVDAALAKALARLPADRFRTAGQFKAGLTDPGWARTAGWAGESVTDTSVTKWRRRFVGAVVFASVATALAAVAYLMPGGRSDAATTAVRRWVVELPDSAPIAFVGSGPLAVGHTALDISRDGSSIAFIGREARTTRLYVRPVGALDATPIAGTEGAYDPFFSPDGTWIAFFAGDALKKVSLSGGAPVTLARAPNPSGGTWTADGWIAFGVEEGQRLLWVRENGGATEERYPAEEGRSLEWGGPRAHPGGSTLVYATAGRVRGLFLDTGDRRDIVAGTAPRFAGSSHLVHQLGGQLLASPFDPERLQTTGPPVPALGDVRIEGSGAAQYAVSDEGTLVYAPGSWALIGRLAWVDVDGGHDYLPFEPALYGRFDRSPDGRRLAVTISTTGLNIWVLDLVSATAVPVTNDDRSQFPLWALDGGSLAFQHLGDPGVFTKPVDSGEPASVLTEAGRSVTPTSWSADGRTLLTDVFEDGSWSVHRILVDGDSPSDPLVSTEFNEWGAVFGPGAEWIAYTTDEPGRFEVFVEPYPPTGQRWQVSTGGGEEATWAPDGSVLYYRDGTRLMAVPISTDPRFQAGAPEVLVEEERWVNVGGRSYLVSPDGRRALMILGPEERTSTRLHVVENWVEELRRLAPPGG